MFEINPAGIQQKKAAHITANSSLVKLNGIIPSLSPELYDTICPKIVSERVYDVSGSLFVSNN